MLKPCAQTMCLNHVLCRTDDFELSQFGSVLLVAAYISSRTKEQENRQAFDMRASKRRRTGRLAHDRQVRRTTPVLGKTSLVRSTIRRQLYLKVL